MGSRNRIILRILGLVGVCLAIIFLLSSFNAREREAITSQMETTSRFVAENPSAIVMLWWTPLWGARPPEEEIIQYCPVESSTGPTTIPCVTTMHRGLLNRANALVFHAPDARAVKYPPQREDQPWVILSQENPALYPVLADPNWTNKFRLTVTYRMDADVWFTTAYGVDPTKSGPIVPTKEKLNRAFAMFSNCNSVKNPRKYWISELQKYYPVDSYGSCMRNMKLPPSFEEVRHGSFKENKKQLMRKYKFDLTFMNANCDYFIDDRLSHALDTGVVPVVMGNQAELYAPDDHSFINVEDFNSPKELGEYLQLLSSNDTFYEEYLSWKINNKVSRWYADHFLKPSNWRCELCAQLYKHPQGLRPIEPDLSCSHQST